MLQAGETKPVPVSGVSSEGLSTTVQPAASAGDTLRVIMLKGKFLQGRVEAQCTVEEQKAKQRGGT